MEVFWDLAQVPDDFGTSAVTIGNFDGMHQGHQAVLARLAETGRSRGMRSLAVTFDPHPRLVHAPDQPFELISGTEEKLAQMALTGIDGVLVQHYDLAFARQSPEQFVTGVLVEGLRAGLVAVGRDVQFGWQNSGDLSTLRALGEKHGFEVVVIDDVGDGARFSSTEIRALLAEGDVSAAGRLLGRTHAVTGTVVPGDKRGRDLGFPTANLGGEVRGLVPADGVYAGWTTFGGDSRRHPSAISVGSNPTFEGVSRRVESHVIDRRDEDVMDFDVYGRAASVEFVERLRGQIAFEGLDALVAQMNEDVNRVREILAAQSPAP